GIVCSQHTSQATCDVDSALRVQLKNGNYIRYVALSVLCLTLLVQAATVGSYWVRYGLLRDPERRTVSNIPIVAWFWGCHERVALSWLYLLIEDIPQFVIAMLLGTLPTVTGNCGWSSPPPMCGTPNLRGGQVGYDQ